MIGQRIRKYRDRLGLTQSQLAEYLGTTSNTVARWERDEAEPPLQRVLIFRLAQLCDIWPRVHGKTPAEKLKSQIEAEKE